jgi:hypothetical protein
LVLVSSGGVGLGTQRHSVTLADAVASCAPKPPDGQPAGEILHEIDEIFILYEILHIVARLDWMRVLGVTVLEY